MSASHKLFFAVIPTPAVRESIVRVQSQIADELAVTKGRPVPATRLHATLLFLGNHTTKTIAILRDLAAQVTFSPCNVTLDRIGWFPRAGAAWLGASEIPEPLQKFQLALASHTRAAGIDFDDRPWRLHITLYRNMRKRPARIHFEPIRWSLAGFELMESVSDSNGLRYEVRDRFDGRGQAI